MLIQSSLCRSSDAYLSTVPDPVQQEFPKFQTTGDQECPSCDKNSQGGGDKRILVYERKNKERSSSSLNLLRCPPVSTVTTMSESSSPTFVYKRRKMKSSSTDIQPCYNCFSASSSEAPVVDVNSGPTFAPNISVKLDSQNLASNSGSIDGGTLGLDASREDPVNDAQRGLNSRTINDSCSSSKSNMDDIGECSSSGAPTSEGLREGLSEKDVCISLLRRSGLLERVPSLKGCAAAEYMGGRDSNTSQSCKVCGQSETTLKMIICDYCEESFHLACCRPPIKKAPSDDWICQACLAKKLKRSKEAIPKKYRATMRENNDRDASGPIALSLTGDDESYTTKVRIGEEFQAEVPDWCGPVAGDIESSCESEVLHPSKCACCQEKSSRKPTKLSFIGNWLQCRAVIDGLGQDLDGTICGKWRRAPLFEVQTDNWECFCSFHWDPAHADCAVAQELDTDQIQKQLKYIEMLRPRLAANRNKLVAKLTNTGERNGNRQNQ